MSLSSSLSETYDSSQYESMDNSDELASDWEPEDNILEDTD